MKATISNRTRRPMRLLVRSTLDQFEVEVREARGSTRKVTAEGVLLLPGDRYDGPLLLNVRRGASVLGIHNEQDALTTYPRMTDGEITRKQLLSAAAEFDKFSGGETYTATAFVLHMLPAVTGTPEYVKFTETLKDMLADSALVGAGETNG